jgi:UDP-glucose 4-epimerase
MRILVTGATGYIGAHVCDALHYSGHVVYGTDYNTNQNDISNVVEDFLEWDIREPLSKSWLKIDKVVHIAAMTKVPNSVKNPYDYYMTNVIGTKNVIDLVDSKHMVYCSTGSAFDPSANPYAATKHGGELITQQFCDKYSLVRFYNVSGNDGRLKYDDDVSHLIRKAARVVNAVKNRENSASMNLFGNDFDTRDGTCVRNYTHIKDIVDGVVRITEGEATNQVECLGSPKGVSVLEVIDTMKRVSGIDFKVNVSGRRDGDIATSTVPIESQFFEETKTLEDMCRDALEVEK